MQADLLRVSTFNIRHCRGRDGRVDIERTAGVIRAFGADLIALQEIDVNLPRSDRVDQPAELAKRLGMHVHFWPTIEFDGGRYGIALATPDELATVVKQLPRLGDEEPRVVVVARWGDTSFLSTHLSRDRRARALQTRRLAELASQEAGATIVAGDLNQGVRSLGPLAGAGLTPVRADRGRFRTQIDHVLIGPDLAAATARFVPTDASDHYPLVVDIVPAMRET